MTHPPTQPPPPEPSAAALDASLEAWTKKTELAKKAAESVDWSKVDFSKLDPKKVGVEFGPVMTEEQFKEYRKNRRVHVMKQQQ